jgi:hypothetical protein
MDLSDSLIQPAFCTDQAVYLGKIQPNQTCYVRLENIALKTGLLEFRGFHLYDYHSKEHHRVKEQLEVLVVN